MDQFFRSMEHFRESSDYSCYAFRRAKKIHNERWKSMEVEM
jgi:hypothetical protein